MTTRKAKKERLALRLYVAGNAPNSLRAVANLSAICEEVFAEGFKLEIVDLLENPARAAADGIVVTPTLLKLNEPAERLVGNLSDTDQVRAVLGKK
jgi:circadian clock protein KaiB